MDPVDERALLNEYTLQAIDRLLHTQSEFREDYRIRNGDASLASEVKLSTSIISAIAGLTNSYLEEIK